MIISRIEKPKQEIPPLLNPPLLEAAFELHWELQSDPQTKRLRDPSYPMMYGRLYERFKKELPVIEDLPSLQMHPEAAPYVVRHRMRKEKNGYPLIQVGPGLATANEGKNYSWNSFKAIGSQLSEAIYELYPKDGFPLKMIKCEMRYLNAIRVDENPLSFLAEKLHTKVEVAPDLFALHDVEASPAAVNLNLIYPLRKPVGNLALSLHLGQANGYPAYILQILVQSLGDMVPDRSKFTTWASQAHDVATHCFTSFCKGRLMEGFCRT